MSAQTPNSAQPPIPKPRKKGPAPPKPVPYRQHKVNKNDEITTFKSHIPTKPRPMSPLDAQSSFGDKAENRKSLKGEPSDEFFNPSRSTPAPVACTIPSFPVDLRPRLNTPYKPSELGVSGGKLAKEADLNGTIQEREEPVAASHTSSSGTAKFPPGPPVQVSPKPAIEGRPRLETPSLPPQPDTLVRSSEMPTPLARGRRRPPPKPGRVDTSPAGDGSKGTSPDEVRNKTVPAPGSEKKEESDASCVYSVVDVKAKKSAMEARAKKLSSSSLSSASAEQKPSLTNTTADLADVVSNREDQEEVSTPDPLNTNADYSVTSHVNRQKPSRAPPPSSDEYSVTSHWHGPANAVVPGSSDEYSRLRTSSPNADTTLSSSNVEGEYTILQDTSEYSKLPSSPTSSEPVEGYDTLVGIRGVSPGSSNVSDPSPSAVVPAPVQDPDYEVISDTARKVPPVRPSRKPKPSVTAALPPVPLPEVSSKEAKPPKPKPEKPARGNLSTPSSPSRPRNPAHPVLISPKPARKLPPTPATPPKPPVSPKLGGGRAAKLPPLPKPTKPKPAPLSTKPKLESPGADSQQTYLNASPDSTPSRGGTNKGVVIGSPKVEIDVDQLVEMRRKSLAMEKTKENGEEDLSSEANRDGSRSELNEDKRHSYENQSVKVSSPEYEATPAKGHSYENQEVSVADSEELSVPPTPKETDAAAGVGSYTSTLSPSECFTVPQHAIPGPHNYCEIDVDAVSSSSLVTSPHTALVGESGDAIVPSSNLYPNAQGYFDLNIVEDKTEEVQNGDESPHTRAGGEEQAEDSSFKPEENASGAPDNRGSVSSLHGQSDSLTNGLLDTSHNEELATPCTPEALPTSTADASLVTSSNTSLSTTAEGANDDGGRGNLRARSSSSPRTRGGKTVDGGKQYGPRRTLSAKRRPPPPPPPPSTPRPALPSEISNSFDDTSSSNVTSPTRSALRTGLCTLPRAKRTGGGAPPRSARPPPPPVPYNTQKKTRGQPPPPPTTTPAGGESVPPSNRPPSPTSPPSSASSITSSGGGGGGNGLYLGPPQGLVSSSELSTQPGLKKKLMGFFKMSASEEGQDFSRQSSFRRSKKKSKAKKEARGAEIEDSGWSNSVTKTLPRNMGSKVHTDFSAKKNVEEDLEFGIYSTIPDTTKKPPSSTPPGGRKVRMLVFHF